VTLKVVPFPNHRPTRDELVGRVRRFVDEDRVGFDHPHFQERLVERAITMRQVLEVLKHGVGVQGPTLDQYGDWRIKLRRMAAGRRVQVVVAVTEDFAVVVTVI
jgi:hypothetical protein